MDALMDNWDWNSIHVLYGEWWLFVLFLLTALLFGIVGFFLGRKNERDKWQLVEEKEPLL